MATKKKTPLIHPTIIEELRHMAEVYNTTAADLERNNEYSWAHYHQDAQNLLSAADKLEKNNLELTKEESVVVQYELNDWLDKDWVIGSKSADRQIMVAMARLGFLEKYDENNIYIWSSRRGSRKRRTITVDGNKYFR